MFKLKNGFAFERLADGAVRILAEVRDASGHVTGIADTEISPDQWPNLVAGLSAGGKTAANKKAARALHEA